MWDEKASGSRIYLLHESQVFLGPHECRAVINTKLCFTKLEKVKNLVTTIM